MKKKCFLYNRAYYFFNCIKLFCYKYLFNNQNYKSKSKNIKYKISNIFTIIFVSAIFLFTIICAIFSIALKPMADDIINFINSDLDIKNIYEEQNRAITIRDRNSKELTTIYPKYGGRYKRVEYEDMPSVLIDAVISAEDKNFFKHNGVDYTSIIKAGIRNYRAGYIVSGGSTITQQLIKNIYPRSRTYIEKFYEALDAIKIEKHLSKEDILTIYLNKIFFGNNIYGIASASDIYFNKDIKEITVSEAAMLASIIKSGTMFNPYKYSDNLENRRQYVVSQMHKNGYITKEQYTNALANKPDVHDDNQKFLAPHFSMYINQIVKSMELKEISEVHTTIDLNIQKEAEAVLRNTTQWLHSFNVRNVSCVILDAKTGEVLTMIGSLDYSDFDSDGSVNGATSLRQAGSTLKPFLYGYIFDEGESPASVMADIESFLASSGGFYSPVNYSKKYYGPVTIRSSLANSLNVSTVRWLDKYSISNFQNILKKSGLSSINKHYDHYGLSMALGSPEVRLIDLASAYSTFANDGLYKPYYSINKIYKTDGSIIKPKKAKSRRVFSKESSFLVTDILTDRNARLSVFPNLRGVVYPFSVAIKTGTSKDFRDAWAFGYTKDYVVGIWLGDFAGSSMHNITGGNSAVPIVYDIFLMLNKKQKETKWNKPSTIITKSICSLSGKYPTANCDSIIDEMFNQNNIPNGYCQYHSLYKRINSDGQTEEKIFISLPYEYKNWQAAQDMSMPSGDWVPSDVFRNSRIYEMNMASSSDVTIESQVIQSNDNYENIIADTVDNNEKNYPYITSPKMNSIYRMDGSLPIEYQRISLSASIPKNAIEYIWYCNGEEYIRKNNSDNDDSVRWQLKSGEHVFKVAAIFDDNSSLESDTIYINVR